MSPGRHIRVSTWLQDLVRERWLPNFGPRLPLSFPFLEKLGELGRRFQLVRPVSGGLPTKSCNQPGALRVSAVLDPFFAACLEPDCCLHQAVPGDELVLKACTGDMLLIQAAWAGSRDRWSKLIALYPRALLGDLRRLVQGYHRRGVASVFWNTEDPVHFERFIRAAALCDVVFTSDTDCIPAYRKRLGHDRIFALPFAAQPALHNPIESEPRDKAVCFAGTYWPDRYPERRRDIHMLLEAARNLGLVIYDRAAVSGRGHFPQVFQGCVQGALPYDQMVQAYKRFKVFLNVNSVTRSPTMFAMRVFELLASGTPVVSSYARGIEELFGSDVVALVHSPVEARAALERLLGDPDEWARVSRRGVRAVMRSHTYADRLAQMAEAAHLDWRPPSWPRFGVVAYLDRTQEQAWLRETLDSQTVSPAQVWVLGPGARGCDSGIRLAGRCLEQPSLLQQELSVGAVSHLALCRAGDGYGPEYLEDAQLSLRYSTHAFRGKRTRFSLQGRDGPELREPGHENRATDSLPAASLIVRRDMLTPAHLSALIARCSVELPPGAGVSLDRFQYLESPEGHDWPRSGAWMER